MDREFQNLTYNGEHPPHEHFLMFIDGELPPKEMQKWESHLEACWECRVKVGKTDETIADIIEFENAVMKDFTSQPSGGWRNFETKLNQLVEEKRQKSFRYRFSNFWLNSRISQFATASLAFILVFAIIFQLLPKTVSAGELLKRSNSAFTNQILSVSQPVVYQKIKITTNGKSAILEVWNDVEGKRNKFKQADDIDSKEIISQLKTVFANNNLEIQKPLSSEIYQNWSTRFGKKQETVKSAKTVKDENAFELLTKISGNHEIGKITESNLLVRESDWHPVGGFIKVKTADGEQVFEISEVRFRIIKGVTIKDDFFRDDGLNSN